jgi:hypothetical protein
MRRAFAALAVMLAACAPMEWYRPDVGAAQTEEDARQCADQAWRATSWNYLHYYSAFGPWVYRDPFGRSYWGPYGTPYGDRFMEETRLADFCMQAKGYRLEATQK